MSNGEISAGSQIEFMTGLGAIADAGIGGSLTSTVLANVGSITGLGAFAEGAGTVLGGLLGIVGCGIVGTLLIVHAVYRELK